MAVTVLLNKQFSALLSVRALCGKSLVNKSETVAMPSGVCGWYYLALTRCHFIGSAVIFGVLRRFNDFVLWFAGLFTHSFLSGHGPFPP